MFLYKKYFFINFQLCLSQGDFTAMMLVLNDNLSESQTKPPAKPVTTQTVSDVLPGETIVANTAGELWFFVLNENQSVVETKLPVKPVTTQTVSDVLPGETIVADTAGELWFFPSPQQSRESKLDFGHICNIEF